MANRNCRENIACVKSLLGVSPSNDESKEQSMQELIPEITGKDIFRCPHCRTGTMILDHLIPRFSVWVDSQLNEPQLVDT